MKRSFTYALLVSMMVLTGLLFTGTAFANEESVAMKWNKVMLNGIRKDAARPTVQARNLFHASILMYDCWAVYDDDASTFFLGKTFGDYTCSFDGAMVPADRQAAQEKAISYAMYRFMAHRYSNAPLNNWNTFILGYCNDLMAELGYPTDITSTDYSDGDPAKLGNYIAAKMQEFAFQDGSNQQFNYANLYYQTVNANVFPELPGNSGQYDGNRWQPLSLSVALDQNGFPIANGAPALSPEWGNVVPFALTEEDKVVYHRDSYDWNVYHEQGEPPYIDTVTAVERQWDEDFFRWGFATVAIWHSFHDTSDGVMKDISPAGIGNVDTDNLPTTFEEFKQFYNVFNGGDPGTGYDVNPVTGLPYEEQLVPRADYTRVLSEYWADGPQSETPPGHWFVNINNITNHPLLEKRWGGQGPIIDDLEWDVRCYFALGGGIHDAAVACWSTKGYYDFTRPIMAIRYMVDHGQCSDMSLPNYDPAGIPLIPGFIEVVEEGDPLAGEENENVGKVKLYTFRGPVEATGLDGVGWILGENWWTFQVRTFVTPPFPGYYSGHSTYSRSAAEVLERITGSEYYPGGYGEFVALENEYLRASPGPSVTTRLQWAKFRDAADQCSLSRIYGGLHPPFDDIPGRKVGRIVGPAAFEKAEDFMLAGIPHVANISADKSIITDADAGTQVNITVEFTEDMNTGFTPEVLFPTQDPSATLSFVSASWTDARHYVLTYDIADAGETFAQVIFKVNDAKDADENSIVPALQNLFVIDTFNPSAVTVNASADLVNDEVAADGVFTVAVEFNESMDESTIPSFAWNDDALNTSLAFNGALSFWESATTFNAFFDAADENIEVAEAVLTVSGALDLNGNVMTNAEQAVAVVDTRNPMSTLEFPAIGVNLSNVGSDFSIQAIFDEAMSSDEIPTIEFTGSDISSVLTGLVSEGWLSESVYEWMYSTAQVDGEYDVNITIEGGRDMAGNLHSAAVHESALHIDFDAPSVAAASGLDQTVTDASAVAQSVSVNITFDEEMNTESTPVFEFSANANGTFTLNAEAGSWLSATEYNAVFDAGDLGVEADDVTLTLIEAMDAAGNNVAESYVFSGGIVLDTRNPLVSDLQSSVALVDETTSVIGLTLTFDEDMNTAVTPLFTFTNTEVGAALSPASGIWTDATTYSMSYSVSSTSSIADTGVEIEISNAEDALGNPMETSVSSDVFEVDIVVGISELSGKTVSAYPNPLREGQNLVLELPVLHDGVVIELFDAAGKMIRRVEKKGMVNGRMELTTADLSAGNYLVHLVGSELDKTFQLIVSK